MPLTPRQSRRKRYRAAAVHGEFLVVPEALAAGGMLYRNTQSFHADVASATTIAGCSIAELRRSVRQELLQLAIAHTCQYREPRAAGIPACPGENLPSRPANAAVESNVGGVSHLQHVPLIMTGHQPLLFHPGVWFKNFVTARLAASHAGIAVNVLVDNDVIARPEVRVPSWNQQQEVLADYIPIDAADEPMPIEQRRVKDFDVFESFGRRAAAAILPLVQEPLVTELWPHAIASAQRHGMLGLALAESRHLIEKEWGIETLEIPFSALCQLPAFQRFVAHVLWELPRFATVYNQAIVDYRQQNGLRSQTHPAPLLRKSTTEAETPFWVWANWKPIREPLVLRRGPGDGVLQAGFGSSTGWKLDMRSPEAVYHSLRALAESGICIRPRALLTTFFCRMFLCDLFVHGIGGGKYDEVTDMLIADFLSVAPPEYMVVSATFQLPIGKMPVKWEDIVRLNGLLRELWFHPESGIDSSSPKTPADVLAEIQRKRQLIDDPPAEQRKAWHRELQWVNARLRSFTAPRRELLEAERQRLVQLIRADQFLASREFSLCLFPARTLRRELRELAKHI